MKFPWNLLVRFPGWLLIAVARGYQHIISPWFPAVCRFRPTCSTYFILAIQKYGAIRGTLRGLWRICRCHPFHPGGDDPP